MVVKLDPNILEEFSKTNKFSEAVYNMIKAPSDENEDKLDEFMGDNLELGGNSHRTLWSFTQHCYNLMMTEYQFIMRIQSLKKKLWA